jgi:hypothetical protein
MSLRRSVVSTPVWFAWLSLYTDEYSGTKIRAPAPICNSPVIATGSVRQAIRKTVAQPAGNKLNFGVVPAGAMSAVPG